MKSKILLTFCLIYTTIGAAQTIYYVDATATGADNGSSWANAYNSLENALVVAATAGDEIRVAGNQTHTPSASRSCTDCTNNRDWYFLVDQNISLKGSYNTTTDLQDYTIPTILSGDLNDDDVIAGSGSSLSITNNNENTHRVLLTTNLSTAALIDGFTITGGNANQFDNITVNGLSFFNNGGGGMHNDSSSPTISNTTFTGNSANLGGGMYNSNSSSPIIDNITFSKNFAGFGGGIYNLSSSPTISNTAFTGNTVTRNGGGMNSRNFSSPTISNTTFTGNTAARLGGGMYNLFSTSPTISNTTFTGNIAMNGGGGIYNSFSSSPTLYNTVLYGNGTDVVNLNDVDSSGSINTSSSNNFSENFTQTGFTMLSSDPFVNSADPDGADDILGTADDGILPNHLSVLIDTGDNANIPANITTDITGQARIFNGTGTAIAIVDVGAYEVQENQCSAVTANILYVKPDGLASATGANWDNATTLQQALLLSKCAIVAQIWVKAGTYFPSNTSTSSDTFSITSALKMYGSFAGTEATLAERTFAQPTIISGDLNGNNITDIGDSQTLLTISNPTNEEIIVNGVTFQHTFSNAVRVSGAVNVAGGADFENCIFRNNIAQGNADNGIGGAILNLSGTTNITNSLFYKNEALNYGGAISVEGGTVNAINSTFANNDALRGGAVHFFDGNFNAINSIFSNNSGLNGNINDDAPTSRGVGSTTYSLFYNTTTGNDGAIPPAIVDNGNNIENTDPQFSDAGSDDYVLMLTSAAVDSGDNSQNTTTIDLSGNNRIENTTIDLGAYEVIDTCAIFVDNRIYVNSNATGANTGESWINAFTDLQDALANVDCADEIWVAQGTYKPGTDENDSFSLNANQINILGGFNGTETMASERNWAENNTILSGDLNNSNSPNAGDSHIILNILQDNIQVSGFIFEYAYNDASRFGAAILNSGNSNLVSESIIRYNSVEGNADNGIGAGFCNSTTAGLAGLYNSLVHNNFAEDFGGAVAIENSSVTIFNTTIVNNTAGVKGGGIHATANSVTNLQNSILYNNSGTNGNINIDESATVEATNVLFYNTTTGNNGNLPPNVTDNGNNIYNSDPLFVDAANADYRISLDSPAIDEGANAIISVTKDLAFNNRINDGNGDTIATIDLGAYEVFNPCASIGTIIYVDATATSGDNTGADWANAFIDLEAALASQDCGFTGEIRVAGNQTHTPSTNRNCTDCTSNRDWYFLLDKNISLKGSYNTTTDLQDYTMPTFLSGNLGASGNADNSHHVLLTTNLSAAATIDGFTITEGYANELGDIIVSGLTFNRSKGGGMFNNSSSLIINNTTFTENIAGEGGGMANISSSPIISNTTFMRNFASLGGGMYNNTSFAIINNSTFMENFAHFHGGGMYNDESLPTIINSTFTRNTSISQGGGIYNRTSSSPTLYNTVLYGNGTDVFNSGGNINTSSSNNFSENFTQTGFTTLSSDPFVNSADPDGADDILGTADDGLVPNHLSVLIDAGDNANIPASITTDITGQARIFNGTDTAIAIVDVGAYEVQENQCSAVTANILYVKPDGLASATGANWDNATTLQQALLLSKCAIVAQIWVKDGTYFPSNTSAVGVSFSITRALKIYGSFAGTEATLAERTFAQPTIISGDLNGNNITDIGDSQTLLTISNSDNSEILLNGITFQHTFSNAVRASGAIDVFGGADFENCIFRNNIAQGNADNGIGGAILNWSGTTNITNSLFYNNEALNYGGAISVEGGTVNAINSTFANNDALRGGAVHFFDGNFNAINSIFSNNSGLNGNINDDAPTSRGVGSATYSLFYNTTTGNDGAIPPAIVDNGNNIVNTDPQFSDAGSDDYVLMLTSAAVDSGDNSQNTTTIDLSGNNRIENATIDLGAYEVDACSIFTDNLIYVDINATGANTGKSWANAFTDLQDALLVANDCPIVTTIYVSQGTYYPTTTTDINISFNIPSGTRLYGGFSPNNGATDLATRDFREFETVLSGNIGIENEPNDNTARVVTIFDAVDTTIDGIFIKDGTAGFGIYDDGAGMYIENSTVTLENLKFENNLAFGGGALALGEMSNVSLKGTEMFNNISPFASSAIFTTINTNLSIENSLITNNRSSNAGAIFIRGALQLINTTITENTHIDGLNLPAVTNDGGAVSIVNSIIWNHNNEGSPTIDGGNYVVSHSIIEGSGGSSAWEESIGIDGGNNLDEDPGFSDTEIGDYSLFELSSAIDAGDNTAVSSTEDLAGNLRIIDGDNNGTEIVDLGAYEIQSLNCSITTIYTIAGGWDNGEPTMSTTAIIAEDYSTSLGNISACELVIQNGAMLTVEAGTFVSVENNITVNGSLQVAHTGSVVQINDDALVNGAGATSVLVDTPEIGVRRFMLLGSPLDVETRENVWASAWNVQSHTPENFNPVAAVTDAYNFADAELDDWNLYTTGVLNPGEGFLVRPQESLNGAGGVFNYDYNTSPLTNGVVSRPLNFNTTQLDSPNMLSNPYASAIDANAFLAANDQIDALYFWEPLTAPDVSFPGSSETGVNYSMGDVSFYNAMGGLPPANDLTLAVRTNVISTAQGFATFANAAGTATFDNSMRLTTGNTTLRGPEVDRNRLWLAITSDAYTVGGTTLVGFTENATAGFDPKYDSQRIATHVSLFSHIEADDTGYAVQGREGFDAEMQIALGFSSIIEEETAYTISLSDFDGAAWDANVPFLIDTATGSVTNLYEASYHFTSDAGIFNNRFILQFKDRTVLDVEEVSLQEIFVSPNPTQGVLTINSPTIEIQKVALIDLQGRIVKSIDNVAAQSYTLDISEMSSAVYFISIETEAGVMTKRVIKK